MSDGVKNVTSDLIGEFDTEHICFRSLGHGAEGPKKIKLVQPWPADRVPPASATLLSVASKPGLLAAAGPDTLIVTSTEKVRKAFDQKAGEWDVVTDFTPDVTIPLSDPPLRHVVFSTDGDFLVISAEQEGALAVFNSQELVQGKQAPERQIKTEGVAVRVLSPNPAAGTEHYMAVVLDSGKLWVVDVNSGEKLVLRSEGVSCAAWSPRGKAVAAGLHDGTVAIYKSDSTHVGTIPQPTDLADNYEVSGLSWLQTTELLIVHSPKPSETDDSVDNKYHLVESNKQWNNFTFHPTEYDPLLTCLEPPERSNPPRLFASRLQNWQPDLNDMLIMTNSHSDSITLFTSSSKPLSPNQAPGFYEKYKLTPPEETRRAVVPRLVYGEVGDSLVVGDAVDLSATEKILRPISTLEEISEAPWPLPAYMILTHQGVLLAWWVVWNKSVEAGTCYPGIVAGDKPEQSTPQPAKTTEAATPASAAFAKPTSTFGQPTATFGQPSTPATPASNAGAGLFSKPAATFGAPSVPQFGAPSLGSASPFAAKPSQPFGAATPAQDKPAAAPAFGSPSMIGGVKGSGFGAVGGMGNTQSPWGAKAQPPSSTQAQTNPFSTQTGGTTGFAKFGQAGGGSSFSSFGSNNGAQSGGFASLGQQQSKSEFPALKTEPSGSTITIGSGTGSSLPSWANTPAQQGGSVFGQTKSSFNTSSFESRTSELTDEDARKRDEATPTPQAPPQSSKGLFGLAGGFSLGTASAKDGKANDDPAKPAAATQGSWFGSDFAAGIGENSLKPPATPAKEAPKDHSTTPASPPRQQKSLFSGATPAKDSATPKAPPPAASTPKTDDAPLPPDFLTTKPSKAADDDLPPLAGSPGVKVEAPSSSPEASPLDKDDDEDGSEFSVEEDDESADEEEAEEPSPSDATRRPQSKTGGWAFQDSVNQSPRVFPPAPTPPANKSGATSMSGRSASPAQPSPYGMPAKAPQTTTLFGQQPQRAGYNFGPGNKADQSSLSAKPLFPLPTSRAQEGLRSPSPVRSASASASRTRRSPLVPPGSSLSASIQQEKPPTPHAGVADLQDEEDERIRQQLAQPIEPSRTLEGFTAYQNYTGASPNKTGHAAQIEMIYKDINGMIDALGWNVRSIKSFTEYHKTPQSGHKADRQTLEDIEAEGEEGEWFEQWTLGEIGALKSFEDELEHQLVTGQVQDVDAKHAQIVRLLQEKAKLMTRLNDVRRTIINRKDPDRIEATRKAPLSREMSDKQKQLRNEYARLLTQLSQAEEASILLRSRLASHNAQNGKPGAVPTVEAVKKTITKMAALAEKRNNDITMIESQMRKIGLADPSRPSSSSSRNVGTPRRSRGTSLRNSIADSPFATPPTSRSKMSLSELNRRALTPDVDLTPTASKGYGLSYAPEDQPNAGSELARMSDLVDENIDTLRETARRRKQVAAGLKKALLERGVKETKIR